MKMNEPIGNSIYGPLVVRLSIGSYFVLAGLRKLDNLQPFIKIVEEFHILPAKLAPLYGVTVPYLELSGGILLLFGFWTTLGSTICSLLLSSYIIAIGVFPHQSSELFNKDIIILAATLSLLWTGAGALSIDKFRKAG